MKGLAPLLTIILITVVLVGGIMFFKVPRNEGLHKNEISQTKENSIECPDEVIFERDELGRIIHSKPPAPVV